MIKPLRKRHLQVWMAWAALLPTGIIFTWLAIPDLSPVKLLQSSTTDLLPVIKRTTDQKEYLIHLRSNKENTSWQLEWKCKSVLMIPSAVIYQVPAILPSEPSTSFNPKEAILIGRIEAQGDYTFQINPDSTSADQLNLIVYDFIHQKIIDRVKL